MALGAFVVFVAAPASKSFDAGRGEEVHQSRDFRHRLIPLQRPQTCSTLII